MSVSAGKSAKYGAAPIKQAIQWLSERGNDSLMPNTALATAQDFLKLSQDIGMRPTALACVLEMALTRKPVLLHSFELEKEEGDDVLDVAADLNRRLKTSKTVEIINMLMAQFVADERNKSDRQEE